LLIGEQPLGAKLTAETGSLDAAEGRGRVGQVLVDADGAGLNPPRDVGAVIGVRGPDAPAEPPLAGMPKTRNARTQRAPRWGLMCPRAAIGAEIASENSPTMPASAQ
jgi:hypothetical protein